MRPGAIGLCALTAVLALPSAPEARQGGAQPDGQPSEPTGTHGPIAGPPGQLPAASQPTAASMGEPASSTAAPASPEPSAELAARALLREAIDLYLEGQYARAAALLRPLVEHEQLSDLADQKEALRTFGVSLYLSGGQAGAERAFRDLLRLEPGTTLDPAFVRPEVVAFFDQVKRSYQRELNQVVRERGPQGLAVANLLPPWGQFQNGHRTKGYALLGGELLFGIVSVTTASLLYTWEGETQQFEGHQSAYQPLRTTNFISFGLLVGCLAYGLIDGLYYYYHPPTPDSASVPPRHGAHGATMLRWD